MRFRTSDRRQSCVVGHRHDPRLLAARLVVGLAALSAVVLPTEAASAATDTVTTCAGSGPGSLAAIVGRAVGGDTIDFSVNCPSSSPIVLASTIDIDTNLTIDGPGPNNLAVSGGNAVEVFDVEASATAATISGLTIENGSTESSGGSPGGGGIDNHGVLNVVDSTLSGNVAGGLQGGNGGAIENDGTLTVTDTTLSGNNAGPHGASGGGINNDGTLTVTDSTLADNVAVGGGGIRNDLGGTADVISSTLSGNTAPAVTGAVSPTPGQCDLRPPSCPTTPSGATARGQSPTRVTTSMMTAHADSHRSITANLTSTPAWDRCETTEGRPRPWPLDLTVRSSARYPLTPQSTGRRCAPAPTSAGCLDPRAPPATSGRSSW